MSKALERLRTFVETSSSDNAGVHKGTDAANHHNRCAYDPKRDLDHPNKKVRDAAHEVNKYVYFKGGKKLSDEAKNDLSKSLRRYIKHKNNHLEEKSVDAPKDKKTTEDKD
jgi:hypothetical protein